MPSIVSEKNFKFWFIWSQKSFPFFSSDHFRWALVQRRRQCFWHVFIYGFFSAWYNFNLYLWITRWTVFTDIDFWKSSRASAAMSSRESYLFLTCFCSAVWGPDDHTLPVLTFSLVPCTQTAPWFSLVGSSKYLQSYDEEHFSEIASEFLDCLS